MIKILRLASKDFVYGVIQQIYRSDKNYEMFKVHFKDAILDSSIINAFYFSPQYQLFAFSPSIQDKLNRSLGNLTDISAGRNPPKRQRKMKKLKTVPFRALALGGLFCRAGGTGDAILPPTDFAGKNPQRPLFIKRPWLRVVISKQH